MHYSSFILVLITNVMCISFGFLVHQLVKAPQISASLKTNFIYKEKKMLLYDSKYFNGKLFQILIFKREQMIKNVMKYGGLTPVLITKNIDNIFMFPAVIYLEILRNITTLLFRPKKW